MRTMAYPGEFHEMPWPKIEAQLGEWCARSPQMRPMLDIVRSVLSSGADAQLAGLLSMTDLVVVARPAPSPPYDEVIVRYQAPWITVETLTHNGRNDRIRRPVEDAVPLFWRFMIEKFGIHPSPSGAPLDEEPTSVPCPQDDGS
ncbi:MULTISPECIES: hypothetical protein [Micromonospora]|uniref:hypothetical protein n=1 Tax=Micromonospora TaxID=1873 RepID=UPI000F88387C|nr:hypothetical protein [Verrucosispora sp. FIM060022]RUL92766.1 hypothetical protein EG812_15300 [Verrucosispora sp. FIM060022]